ncbi:probable serine/threonine-protein kinase pats1 [Saccostrea cucullata]|uniref:probable serine/threonine-protein kinase pats1 n=1 Tax=Saccostrea cuccullata TaxID=36930 RepID=UPI002ED15781
MYAFVTECLVKDGDLEFFLTTASRDVISEYCRSWGYKRSEGERCLYVPYKPEKMCHLFIGSLQLDIITHCTMSDGRIHRKISKRFGVPGEVLQWDQEARERYVEYAKRGTQTVHHARGMIVGCAGAGKTTLLKRLLGCSEEEINEVKSTEGLEVHEEIFEICDETRSLKARKSQENCETENTTIVDPKTLTFFDFGGQCAYYACHQIYLTRRAFYVVVVDASKRLDQKVDKKVCDQDGSVFSGWTYGDYFVFWIKSIHTYCGSDNEKDTNPVVLIVATHWEGSRHFRDKKELNESLRQQFPETSYLPQYITDENVYCTDITLPLHDLKTCFFNIASNKRWSENIPKEWFFFGLEINQKKHSKRILKISEITTKVPKITAKEKEDSDQAERGTQDMLRYYHDAGKALYFNENGLEKEVIIDVQWFVDAFKHIITDKLHIKGIHMTKGDWNEYYQTGNLRVRLLEEIWKHKDEELFNKVKKGNEIYSFSAMFTEGKERYLQYHKKSLLSFMQRLGLVAIGKESYYVPCMNRKEIEKELFDLINKSKSKSSVLVYQFEFLPFFLFFRLIVACMRIKNWEVLENNRTSCLYRNAALFSYSEYNIVLSVTKDSIQLQVFHPMEGYDLEKAQTCRIQGRIEEMLIDLAGTFNRKIQFERGFRCQTENVETIAMDIENHFLSEKRIPKKGRKMMCPLHSVTNRHIIDPTELTRYWEIKRETIGGDGK